MWPNPQFPVADLVTFTEEILNGKLHFLCSEYKSNLNQCNDSIYCYQRGRKMLMGNNTRSVGI